ncbi:AarF/UbiB family protein [Leptospira sp. 96542]|nr:AarF/UbiB family protein [Leptospira sp. 96542]
MNKPRSLNIYFFVFKTWVRYLVLTKIQKRLSTYVGYEIKRKQFLQKKGKEVKTIFFLLGGVYIKIGQFVSNLFHILPEEFLWELQELQDQVPSHNFSEMEKRWFLYHKEPMDKVFTNLSKKAHASASTAQVHIAYYFDKKVAIKILYPDIEVQAKKDLKTIYRILWFIDRFVFKISADEIGEQLGAMIETELNLENELRFLKQTKLAFANERDFFFPNPIEELCNKHILVTEYVEGKKIYELNPELHPHKKNPYLEKLMRAYILMIFDYRFFHADPHPGNLIFMETGELCFIDFGAVQFISEEETEILERILVGAMRKDYHGISESLFALGAVTEGLAKEELIKIIQYSLEKLNRILSTTNHFRNLSLETLKPMEDLRFLKEIQVSLKRLLGSLKLPPNFLSLHRVLALLLGNFSYLDPKRSIFDYAEKPFSQIVMKGGSLRRLWKDEGEEMITSLFSLPKELNDFLYKWNRGEFPNLNNQNSELNRLFSLFTYGVLGSIFFFFGMYYAEKLWKEPSLLFYILSGLSFWSFAKSAIGQWKQK